MTPALLKSTCSFDSLARKLLALALTKDKSTSRGPGMTVCLLSGDERLDGLDSSIDLFFPASCKAYYGISGVEKLGKLLADTCI